MQQLERIGRRAWLARMASGTFVVWAELAFGLGRKGLSIALGDERLAAAGLAYAQSRDPVTAMRVATEYVNAYVLVRGKEIAIVDTGLPDYADKFAEAVNATGLGWDAVGHVILTHYHRDHVGSMGQVLAAARRSSVYAGAADIPRIQSPKTVNPVGDGDEVLGMQIIATPGHTPGHISVYDPTSSLIVLGDAMNNLHDTLSGANPQYSADMKQANQSVKKLAALKFEKAYFGHGEPIEKNASTRVARLAESL